MKPINPLTPTTPTTPTTPDDLSGVGSAHARHAYRDAAAALDDSPSSAMDDAIRAAARRAVHARPQPIQQKWFARNRMPLSMAALVMLSASLVMVVQHEKPDALSETKMMPIAKERTNPAFSAEPTAQPIPPSPPKPYGIPSKTILPPPAAYVPPAEIVPPRSDLRKPDQPLPRVEMAQAIPPASAPAAPVADIAAATNAEVATLRARRESDTAEKKAVGLAEVREPQRGKAKQEIQSVAVTPVVTSPAIASVPPASVSPALPPPPPALAAKAAAESAPVNLRAAPAASSVSAQTADATSNTAIIGSRIAPYAGVNAKLAGSITNDIAVKEALAKKDTAVVAKPAPPEPAEAWLKRILALQEAGKVDAMKEELGKFKKQYPNSVLPKFLMEIETK